MRECDFCCHCLSLNSLGHQEQPPAEGSCQYLQVVTINGNAWKRVLLRFNSILAF
jgi:hypothetical protein